MTMNSKSGVTTVITTAKYSHLNEFPHPITLNNLFLNVIKCNPWDGVRFIGKVSPENII